MPQNADLAHPNYLPCFTLEVLPPFCVWGITTQQVLCISDRLWAAGQAARELRLYHMLISVILKKAFLTLLGSSDTER